MALPSRSELQTSPRRRRHGWAVLAVVALIPVLVLACSDFLAIDEARRVPTASSSVRIGTPPEPTSPAAPPHACVEAETKSDPQHCGSCGHDCRGGSCANGMCEPVKLVGGVRTSEQMTVTDSALAWTGYGGVVVCELPGCRTRRVVDIGSQGASSVFGLASEELFFLFQPFTSSSATPSAAAGSSSAAAVSTPQVFRCSLPECRSSERVAQAGAAFNLKVVADELFTLTSEGIRSCTLPRCDNAKIVAPPYSDVLGRDGDDLIVSFVDLATNRTVVRRCARGGCDANAPVEIAFDRTTSVGFASGTLVWVEGGTFKSCRTKQCGTTTTSLFEERDVFGAGIDGEGHHLVVSTDGKEAFVAERAIGIARAALAGGKPTMMYAGDIRAFAVGGDDIFFFDAAKASLFRVAK